MLGSARDGLAIVLRTVDFGETDRIVHLFVRDEGRVSAIARGARRSRKRFAGALQTGQLVRVRYVVGRSDLARLETAETIRTFEGLLGLERGMRAGEAIALMRRMLEPDHPEPELFDAFSRYLEAECLAPDSGPLAVFLLKALALSGLGPDVAACGICRKPAPEGRSSHFDAARGTLVCRACGGSGPVLGAEVRTAVSEALLSGTAPASGLVTEVLSLARLLVRHHVGTHDI